MPDLNHAQHFSGNVALNINFKSTLMKTILVPMDASACAENALLFAILLAQKQQARLVLVNAFQIRAAAGEVPFEIIEEELIRKKKESEQMLRAQAIKISHTGNLEFDFVALEGAPDDVILDVAKSREASYIIMGTNGEGLATSMFGSTAWHVIEKATCPVIALPPSARFNKPVKRITYATDYRSSDLEAINKLTQLATLWNAQVNILHVDENKMTAEEEVVLMDSFRKKVLQKVNYDNLSFQILYGNDVADRLEKYIEDQNTDLLVMATHRRSFFERLFKKSVTRRIALDAAVPLMAFHYNKESAVKLI